MTEKLFFEKINEYKNIEKKAYINNYYEDASLSYKQILDYSDKLAYYLDEKLTTKNPIVVYGHKHPFMLVYFLACVKSGRAFCPVDINTPTERVHDITKITDCEIVLTTEELMTDVVKLEVAKAKEIIETTTNKIAEEKYVKDEETFYIIFTSGSTGVPKGVEITYNNLNNFLHWYTGYYENKSEQVFLGHPPFSFDLSVMSLWPSFYMGATIVQIDKRVQENFKEMFTQLQNSQATIWISTPSFIEMCFADSVFNSELMPKVEQFVFCGERLFSSTVEKIHSRFPKAEVVNTYGPTESTVMVTWQKITAEINSKYSENLPVGTVKWGSDIVINDANEDGKGEIVIVGNTVAKGYFKNDKLSKEKFSKGYVGNKKERSYYTGDLGYFKDGMLFCEGRMDFQIKLHGHRIELEDIDSNLLKIDNVVQTATVANYEAGKVKSLASHVVYKEKIEKRFETVKQIKGALKNFVPEYMIPKKIVFLDEMPLNNNGKIDKNKLKEM